MVQTQWQILTIKKIDSSDNSVFINNANIDWETSIDKYGVRKLWFILDWYNIYIK